jgi:hypothetical protein
MMFLIAKSETVEQRLEYCKNCDYKSFVRFIPTCGKCKCIIAAKIRLANEKCPIGKW